MCCVDVCGCSHLSFYVCVSVRVCAYGVQRAMLNAFFCHASALKNILLGSGDAHLYYQHWETEAGRSLCVRGQCGLQSEFQDSHGYIEKPCLETNILYV